MKRAVFFIQGVVQIVVGVGAIVSGGLLIAEPSGRLLQAPPEMLQGSPFTDFLLPGIILFLVNGMGQAWAGFLSLRRHPRSGLVGAVFGMGLMIWIFVQVNMIGGGHILQYSYFTIGVIETAFALLLHGWLAEQRSQGHA